MLRFSRLAALALTGLFSVASHAALITNGFTFTVADAFTGASGVGTHFHSNTGGSFGNPAGLAEVGRLSSEETRGLSEYNLAGLSNAPSAFVTFDVNQLGGLFGQSNFEGLISINAYAGNNAEDLSDFEIATTGFVATFDTTGVSVGDIFSFDITSIFNAAITNGDASLGIKLQQDPLLVPNEAIVFNNFRLTTTNDSTNGVPVPAPAPLALLVVGFAAAVLQRKAKTVAA